MKIKVNTLKKQYLFKTYIYVYIYFKLHLKISSHAASGASKMFICVDESVEIIIEADKCGIARQEVQEGSAKTEL